jgi:ribonucleoside-diphosphate reductase alpha chain
MSNNEEIYWLNKDSRKFLSRDYLLEGESPEERLAYMAEAAEKYLKKSYYKYHHSVEWWNENDHECENRYNEIEYPDILQNFAVKFLDYTKRGFYSFSSPVWSNFGRERGLPISCFGSYIPDTMGGILGKLAEVGMMTKTGGGTSGYFGALRGRGEPISSGGESTGSVHFMELYDKLMGVVSQGSVRRGSFASYLPIDHKDIEEFLKIQDESHPIQDLSIGVCVSDEWLKKMVDGDKKARKIWAMVIQKRYETGYPYIFFTDNANNQAPEIYKEKGLRINNSNLCAEIMLSNSPEESFVCDLSSINLDRWDEIKDTDAVELMVYFLDAVMSEFINKTENIPFMNAPRAFAINQRAVGVGVLGWHSLLQSKMIPFESMDAKMLNIEVWSTIRSRTDKATEDMAVLFGAAPIYNDTDLTKRRNVTTIAVAPTTSSSFILGQVSPSIEPLNSNYFVKDLAKGKFTYKNPVLISLLKELSKDTTEVWKSILVRGGSVQHLDFLTQDQKDVFKTFGEISQKEIIIQAAQRQKYIDQGQSLNLMIPPNTPIKDMNQLILFAHEQGIKSLYYQRSSNPAQELARSILTCSTCEA